MSTGKSLAIFDKTVQHSWDWIDDLIQDLELADARSAYRTLRAALHALRDRLTVDEAVNLGAQLPMLLRGLYYEGWRPAETPVKLRTRRSFFERLANELVEERDPDPEEAARAVFDLIARRVSGGEIAQIRGMMPAELKDLWLPELPSSEPSSPNENVGRVPPEILRAVAHRAPNAAKPTIAQIAIQNTKLRDLLGAIDDLLCVATDESGMETESDVSMRARQPDLASRMSELRNSLAEHFSLEERAGLVADAIATVPQLSRRASMFGKEHEALLARASRLAGDSFGLKESEPRWTDFRSDFREFAEDVRQHEREENALLQDAYLRDEGRGD